MLFTALKIHSINYPHYLSAISYSPNFGIARRPSLVLLVLLAVDNVGEGLHFRIGGGADDELLALTVRLSHITDNSCSFSSSVMTFIFDKYAFTLRIIWACRVQNVRGINTTINHLLLSTYLNFLVDFSYLLEHFLLIYSIRSLFSTFYCK